MAKKKVESVNEEVVETSNAIAVLSGGLVTSVDLSQLNRLIENIGTADTIQECDKKPALEAIGTWEESVVEKVQNKVYEIDGFVQKFNYDIGDIKEDDVEVFENIATQIGASNLYEKVKIDFKIYKNSQNNQPEKPLDDVTQSYEDQLLEKKKYEYNKAVHELSVRKARKIAATSWNSFKELMKASSEIKNTVEEMKKYSKKLSKFKGECKDKASYAKLNVSIASPELRTALRDLFNFGLSI